MDKPPTADEINVVSDQYMRDAGLTVGSNRMLSVCRALGQIYVNTDDEDIKLKLRYASTIARYYIYRLRDVDPEWVSGFKIRYKDYEKIMRDK